ncbi:LOW QUALITY PROTEIN: rho guanine nucleotide exchange factor 33 [Lates calcarifer]|uniref:LOW QUALITY PROTEIN: rho guanine nucleotide exchange factor 33 n=1 Tax=Lates calcarifer TaxID=8187 RepID=A0AAJ7PCC2_LATCA|nr:LOW QUALITY PROTEIN: rho guanine nucleotide exchange factor 33 [Lates calcarifer]
MENGKTEEKMEDVSEDKEENVEEANLEIAQLQGLVAELREGLHAALTELCELRHRDHGLEEKLQAHQTDVDDKIMGLKNSLNTFKEELNVALFHIKDVSSRQREVQKRIELLQLENMKDIISVPHSRKSSKADVLTASGDEHICVPSQSELGVIQHFFPSLPHSESPQRSNTSTQTSTSEQEAQPQQQRGCLSKSPAWGEVKNSRNDTETSNSQTENNKRQRAALELLESERVYVSHLSLLLKANITFNGSEALTSKDKRPFPSSLRFLIQQHLELLHTLQERVLKCQWQGIMGDVFMRLTSKESDFLDFYVSYLKELPDCLSVVTVLASSSVKSSALESDIMGDESRPSLYTLLLQPVQRIPEYLLLLQGLLRQTDADHPDYYLLLVCIQQFRSFTAQYHHLLQHNQELLLHNRKEVKRSTMKQLIKTVEGGIQANHIGSPYPCSSAMLEHVNQVKQSKQRLLEQIQSHRFQDWDRERDHETHCYDTEWPAQLPFFSPDLDSRNHKPTGLGSIPESDTSERSMSCQHQLPSRPAGFRQVQPGSALADALGEFLLPPDPPGMESLYEEDGGSLHDISMFDHCSSASSDSSIDIAFVKCPKAPSASHHAMAANVSSIRDVFGNGANQGNGYSKLPNRGCVSPDEAVMMRRNQHRPLQASQRKSKSLNGLQMDNTVSGLDGGLLSDHLQRVGMGSHAKLERQGSKGSKGCPTPSRKVHSPLGNRLDTDKQSNDLHGLLSIDSGIQSWGDESKWRSGTEENNHTPFSERSRKQDKGGFRSSFKKLFKKKSSDEKKDKGGEKTPENQNSEHETSGKNPKLVHLEINRGTAV